MADRGADIRFAVDTMLGRLARWLRILGYDVAYGPHLRGKTLIDCARREDRVLLTRDTRLVRTRARDLPSHLFIGSDHFREQLRQVAATWSLGAGSLLSRCLDCNRLLDEMPREQARARVPEFVGESSPRFWRCGRCGKLFWPATHKLHIERELAGIGVSLDVAS
jgi:uncharacterized protein